MFAFSKVRLLEGVMRTVIYRPYLDYLQEMGLRNFMKRTVKWELEVSKWILTGL